MTLCIGAIADKHKSSPEVVICSDMLLGDDYHKVGTELKTDIEFSDTLAALYSGPWEDCANLKRVLLRKVRANPLTLDNYRGILADGWKEFDAISKGLSTYESTAQCLVAGFIEAEPRIIRIDRNGVDSFPYFASIGIGAYHSDTILSWRNITQYSSLEQVMYFVFEARLFGELCKDVGGTIIMHILRLNEAGALQADIVMAEGLNIMQGWFKTFGPKQVGYDLSFPPTAISRVKDGYKA